MERPTGVPAFEWFRQRLEQDASLLGVYKDKNVEHHVNLLIDAINRAIYNLENKIPDSPITKEDKARKFIVIYQNEFHKATNGSVVLPITAAQRTMIDHCIKMLEKNDGQIEEFIKYVFEEFLPKNPKLMPGVNILLQTWVLQNYFCEYKERIEKRKKIDQNNIELADILNRYRTLMRNEKLSMQVQQELKEVKDAYEIGNVQLPGFKEAIIRAEQVAASLNG